MPANRPSVLSPWANDLKNANHASLGCFRAPKRPERLSWLSGSTSVSPSGAQLVQPLSSLRSPTSQDLDGDTVLAVLPRPKKDPGKDLNDLKKRTFACRKRDAYLYLYYIYIYRYSKICFFPTLLCATQMYTLSNSKVPSMFLNHQVLKTYSFLSLCNSEDPLWATATVAASAGARKCTLCPFQWVLHYN